MGDRSMVFAYPHRDKNVVCGQFLWMSEGHRMEARGHQPERVPQEACSFFSLSVTLCTYLMSTEWRMGNGFRFWRPARTSAVFQLPVCLYHQQVLVLVALKFACLPVRLSGLFQDVPGYIGCSPDKISGNSALTNPKKTLKSL